MRASFIHIADTHLGYEQYGVRERFNDFSRAFWDIIDDAVHREIDFMVIAGDLFHKRAIDALTLIHAIEGLKKLKARGIPVVAIEGNHDRSYYREGISWLQFLCHEQYLTLLNPRMRDGAPVIAAWEQATMAGSAPQQPSYQQQPQQPQYSPVQQTFQQPAYSPPPPPPQYNYQQDQPPPGGHAFYETASRARKARKQP